jgi:hypothetical protein
MPTDPKTLIELHRLTGVADFNDSCAANFDKVTKALNNGKINQTHLETITKNFTLPFLNSQLAFIKNLRLTIDNAAINQSLAIRSVAESLNNCDRILSDLSRDLKSDSSKVEMARCAIELAKLKVQVAEIIAGMNQNNNNFFTFAITACVTIFAIVTGIDLNNDEW